MSSEGLRYVTVRMDENQPLIYNLHSVDITKDVYVTEGPLDSLFLDNAVAAGSSDLNKIEKYVPKDKMVLIFDNQPRKREIVNLISKAIDNNYRMVIWPENISKKDINDMILDGVAVKDIINRNTFESLELKLEFTKWKKI